ncbi:uncharacterized protein LACBIDRAFT_311516 [Laccaria bicolor S238N-H82]|uniref:Predicted protein n=1 Tax=Laccaria bicolor (strain S238N-H82 / ATCC MYA-4686) TaxID=486041 RepID=B0CXK5_LACBS|nr:uncharacterized protein LACBIDRAFT_311516 [Laccaria bicolor S238N-H82]EDR12278.1 predicted protein [Laccaria bicolor S238N-H82]|eukprot:XP_001876542.1 predicted protein [Laccaria bicolor S238N-H82]
MKVRATQQELEEHAAAVRRGAMEGTVVSGGAAVAASYYLHRNVETYRRLPLSLKALGIIIIVAPCLSIQAERRGLEYERSQWEGEGVRILDEKQLRDEKRWQSLTLTDKVGDWAARHEYSIILGGWAASLGLAGAIISRNKYQTYPQKIVQARMWAQGLTIGLVIAAGALTQSKRAETAREQTHDHSWKDLLDQQERDRQLEEAAMKRASLPQPSA